MSGQNGSLDSCGCCGGLEPLTSAAEKNPPGLQAIAYRAGVFGSFRRAMLNKLASTPGVAALTTREPEDPAVALVDAWSVALDVLTFYQERIANEGYLRTSLERLSLQNLAASIGYQLNPGVAAGACLAFTVEDAIGSTDKVQVATGSKAQSVPKQDQLPQMFETVEAIEARPEWNALRPRMGRFVLPKAGDTAVYVKGVSSDLKRGDVLAMIGDERLKMFTSPIWDVRRVISADADPVAGTTLVTLDRPLGEVSPPRPIASNPQLYVMRQRCGLFGGNAPQWKAMPDNIKTNYGGTQLTEWPDFRIGGVANTPFETFAGCGLFGAYYEGTDPTDFTKARMLRVDHEIDFDWTSSGSPDPSTGKTFAVRWTAGIRPPADGDYWFIVRTRGGVRVTYNGAVIIDSWFTGSPVDAFFHMGALKKDEWHMITIESNHGNGDPRIRVEFQSNDGSAPFLIPRSCWLPAIAKANVVASVYLDAVYPKIQQDSWAVFSGMGQEQVGEVLNVVDDARANFTLSAKTTRLQVLSTAAFPFDERLRQTSVYAQSELLEFGERPIAAPVSGNSIELAGVADGLEPGRLLIVSGKRLSDGAAASELVTLDQLQTSGKHTTLFFTSNLQNTYLRSSVSVNANVARATHGDTRVEPLGSGDGSVAFQQFTLKQKPLTFVSAATASGGQSTLEIRIDDILWTEVSSLLEAGPHDRVYTTRISDAGDVTVQFGDGVNGARLPTGDNNVTAAYRVGVGLDAMLDANQINLLMTRPLGLKGVTNPLPSSGAADPEPLEEARRNAPFTVLTLDRIVSLRDYEDFARAFAGIGKAKASQVWEGEHTIVHITVASSAGGAVDETSELYANLIRSIDLARDPGARERIASFEPLPFGVGVSVVIDRPTYLPSVVMPAVKQALIDAYAFESREFAQPVTESELIAVIQRVPGVVAARLNALYDTKLNAYPEVLPAAPARWDTDANGQPVLRPAQLATIDPARIQIDEMKRP